MILGYIRNDMGGTCHMLNLQTKCTLLRYDVICPNKTYGKYISFIQPIKADDYVIHYKNNYDKWSNVRIYPYNTENFNTKQDYRME